MLQRTFFAERAGHYIGYCQLMREKTMRKIFKAMLMAYIVKKVKDKVSGRSSHKRVYRT